MNTRLNAGTIWGVCVPRPQFNTGLYEPRLVPRAIVEAAVEMAAARIPQPLVRKQRDAILRDLPRTTDRRSSSQFGMKGADQISTPPDVTNWRDARIGLDQPWAPQFVQDEIKSAKARYAQMFNQPSNRIIEFRIPDDFYDGCGSCVIGDFNRLCADTRKYLSFPT